MILQNDTENKYSPTTIIAAITSKIDKSHLPTHVNIFTEGLETDSIVLLEQVRTIDQNAAYGICRAIGQADDGRYRSGHRREFRNQVFGGAIEMNENQDQNNAAFYYSVNMLRMLLKMQLITEEECKKIIRISAVYYKAEKIYI